MIRSLLVKNFRTLEHFHVPKLGHVNLIVGKNNSGKSSVLEAIRIYAGNGSRSLLEEIAIEHNEKYLPPELGLFPAGDDRPFQDIFTGRTYPTEDGAGIEIGDPTQHSNTLKIEHVLLEEYEDSTDDGAGGTVSRTRRRVIKKELATEVGAEALGNGLLVTKGEKATIFNLDTPYPRSRGLYSSDASGAMPCSVVPTRFVDMSALARDWDEVVLSRYEQVIKKALKELYEGVEGVAFVHDDASPNKRENRRVAKVKLSNMERLVPINSLGDGLFRVLQLTLKIYPAKGGVLLIDEFENGLHYSVQEEIWSIVFEQAKALGVQVFATTHSWDCIKSFSAVAQSRRDVEGVLFRVGTSVLKNNYGKSIATVFDEEQLYNVTQADLEVR